VLAVRTLRMLRPPLRCAANLIVLCVVKFTQKNFVKISENQPIIQSIFDVKFTVVKVCLYFEHSDCSTTYVLKT